jgi:hypothetical protein
MKLMKLLFTVMLVSAIAFSCKSEKKEAGEAIDDAVEETTEAASDAADAVVDAASDAADAVEEGADAVGDAASDAVDAAGEAVEEVAAAVTEKKITVVFPKDTKLQNEVKASLTEFAKSNPKVEAHLHTAYAFAFFPKITKGGLGIGGAGGKGLVFDNKTVI